MVVRAKMELLQSTREQRTSASSLQPLETTAQLLQSIAEDETSHSVSSHLAGEITSATNHPRESPDSTPAATAAKASPASERAPTDLNPNSYPNLFDSPDPALSNALRWALANAVLPQVASWLHACSQ